MANANSTADRAIEILLLFDDEHPVLSALEIADHFGMSRSTIYRYLASLRSQGLLIELPDGFGLGHRIFELAKIARRNFDILDVASDTLEALSRELGETVLLTQRYEGNVVILQSWESNRPLRISYHRGETLPMPVGASGKVILAYGNAAETGKTLEGFNLDPAKLRGFRQELDEVRAKGLAVNRGEIDEGVAAIAMPILERNGTARYVVSLVAPMSRLDVDNAADKIEKLRDAVNQVSEAWSRISA
jgi:DNA-binding IclR family transcriptional regulator